MAGVPFILVTGFLGSGKTTLLKRVLGTYADTHRIAIVQNEFAPSGVDGAELRRTGKPFEILEINRGSVFCVCLLSDFVKSLAALVGSVRPDVVILEATGLADPIAVAQLLQSPELRTRVYLSKAFCVVDAGNFIKSEKAVGRVAHQVRVADTVIINKVDTAPGASAEVEARLRELNPFAQIVRASQCDIDLADLLTSGDATPVALQRADENAAFESCGRPMVGSVAVRGTRQVSRLVLETFLRRFAPGSYRLKGYVHTTDSGVVAVQSCFGKVELAAVDRYNGASELVAMGPGIDPDEFSRAFEALGVQR